MKRLAAILALLMLPPCAPAQAVTAELTVADEAGGVAPPYRAAELQIVNDSNTVARAVSLRWQGGGPTIVLPAAIPPGPPRKLLAALPALSAQQTYDVRLLADEGPRAGIIARTTAEIHWPAGRVSIDAFTAGQDLAVLAEELPLWPRRLLGASFLLVVLAALGMAAVLFLRPAVLRPIPILAASAIFTLGIGRLLRSQPVVVERPVWGESVLVVGCRRTAAWHSEAARIVPLYTNRRQMESDDLVIRPGVSADVTLHPREARVFRLGGAGDDIPVH